MLVQWNPRTRPPGNHGHLLKPYTLTSDQSKVNQKVLHQYYGTTTQGAILKGVGTCRRPKEGVLHWSNSQIHHTHYSSVHLF